MKVVSELPISRRPREWTSIRTNELETFWESGAKYAELEILKERSLHTNVEAYKGILRRSDAPEARFTRIVIRGNVIYAVREDK